MPKPDFDDKVNNMLCVSDYDKFYIKQWHYEEMKEKIACGVREELETAKEKMAIELEQKIRLDLQAEETEKKRKQCKADTTPVKYFLFDTVSFGDKTYDSREFIRPLLYKYSPNSDKELRRNPYNDNWELHFRTKCPRFISAVNVVQCFIVNPSGPGNCKAFVIFIKGRDRPLIFMGGILSTQRIMTVLQLEETSLDSKWVAEAFRRSLRDCYNISFLFIPCHAGGNILPDGSLTYVSSLNVLPGMESLYPTEIKDHRLIPHSLEFNDTLNNYKKIIPSSWKAKYMLVERVKSILLPWYANNGLLDDRVSVVVYRNENDKYGCIALAKNSNYETTATMSLTDRDVDVKQVLAAANDETIIFIFSLMIESRRTCSQQLNDILLDLKGENGIDNPTRKTIIILTETPARIPEGFPALYLTIDEGIPWSDIKTLQKSSGQFDYSLIDFFYKNQLATDSLVSDSIKSIHLLSKDKNIDLTSKSVEMDLATAWLLKRLGLVTDDEFNAMFGWLTSKEQTAASSTEALCNEIGAIGSEAICIGEITASWQDGQYPPWNPSRIFVGNDGTYNLTPELFQQKMISRMKGTDRYNKACQALEKRGLSYPTRTGEHTRTLTVKGEEGGAIKREFISLSPELFNVEARHIVEKTIISDTFLEYKNCPRQFNPLIKHTNYDLLAGQLIGAYSAINPFVLVTGSPGHGKSDLLMMQATIKAESGDTVFIYDQTDAFCRFEWEAHMVPPEIIDKIVFWDLSTMGWPIELLDFRGCESPVQKVQRLSSLLKSGSHITGPNQLSILQKAVDSIISNYEHGNYDIKKVIEHSLKETGKEGEVRRRLTTMFSAVARNSRTPYDWEELVDMRGKIIVFSAGNAVVNADANPLDMILDSFYGFKDKHRDKNVTLILDEVQRMNIVQGAPIDVILSTGRKMNISAYIATQRYVVGKGNLPRIEEYCGTKIFFLPMDSCVKNVALKTHLSFDELLSFEQGKCAVVGSIYSEHMGKNVPVRKAIVGKTYRPPYVGDYDEKE